jgi:excisionase family DNA binding protein
MGKLMDVYDAADLLNIPRSKIFTMVRKGLIPYFRLPCGDICFDRRELSVWLLGFKSSAIHP